jgi:hypothetical protein
VSFANVRIGVMSARQERERVDRGRIVVRFKDDEIMEGLAPDLSFDRPDFVLTMSDLGSNSQTAIIPVASVKTVLLERREYESPRDGRRLRKVAIRFWDGEVLKGLLASEPERCTYGMTVPVISPALDEIEVFGIPYAAVKAIYFVKSWDGRKPEFVVETGRWSLGRADTPLLDLLGEIRGLSSLRSRGAITDAEFERRRRLVLERI